jgi:hypothetical protein
MVDESGEGIDVSMEEDLNLMHRFCNPSHPILSGFDISRPSLRIIVCLMSKT